MHTKRFQLNFINNLQTSLGDPRDPKLLSYDRIFVIINIYIYIYIYIYIVYIYRERETDRQR